MKFLVFMCILSMVIEGTWGYVFDLSSDEKFRDQKLYGDDFLKYLLLKENMKDLNSEETPHVTPPMK